MNALPIGLALATPQLRWFLCFLLTTLVSTELSFERRLVGSYFVVSMQLFWIVVVKKLSFAEHSQLRPNQSRALLPMCPVLLVSLERNLSAQKLVNVLRLTEMLMFLMLVVEKLGVV